MKKTGAGYRGTKREINAVPVGNEKVLYEC